MPVYSRKRIIGLAAFIFLGLTAVSLFATQRQFVNFAGGVYQSDTGATPFTLVDRDASGNATAAAFISSSGSNNTFNGGTKISVNSYTGATTLTVYQTIVQGNATSGAFTITLPPASSSTKTVYWVTNNGSANNVTLAGSGGTDDITVGATTATTLAITPGVTYFIYDDGTQWWAK
jgi:hypothetical protein